MSFVQAPMRILILAALSVGPAAPAVAQDAVVDPGPDTPAGTQYQIPVDTARQDAAPQRKARKRHNGTTLQSENGFGSSSVVPGAPAAVRVVATPAPPAAPRKTHRKRRRHHATRKPSKTPAPRPAPPTRAATTPVVPAASSAAPPSGGSSGGEIGRAHV